MVSKKCSKLVRLAINATMSGAVVVMGFGAMLLMNSAEESDTNTLSGQPQVEESTLPGQLQVEASTLFGQPQVEASCRNLWGLC